MRLACLALRDRPQAREDRARHRGRGEQRRQRLTSMSNTRYRRRAQLIWALRGNVTAHDAGYIALVEALDATVLTCDRRLASARGTGRCGARCRVAVLGAGRRDPGALQTSALDRWHSSAWPRRGRHRAARVRRRGARGGYSTSACARDWLNRRSAGPTARLCATGAVRAASPSRATDAVMAGTGGGRTANLTASIRSPATIMASNHVCGACRNLLHLHPPPAVTG